MTDLLSRPTTSTTSSTPRPLAVGAAIAAAAAAGFVLLICAAMALVGWFLADAGAHGTTVDALRVGVDAWLSALGGRVTLNGLPIGPLPLALTGLVVAFGFRWGRWAARTSEPTKDVRQVGIATGVGALTTVAIAVVLGLLASQPEASVSLPRAILGALVFGGLGLGLGLADGTGVRQVLWDQVPGWVRSVIQGATATVLLLGIAAAVLVTVALAFSFNEAEALTAGLRLGVGDALTVLVVLALFAPNVVLLGISYLIGAGFAVGTGTVVSPTAVDLGPLPAIPVLAALPASGPQPGWLAALLALPVLAAMWSAGAAQLRYAVPAWDSSALRGFGVGAGAGLICTVGIALAGGPLGTGRLADIGAPIGQVFVVGIGGMSLGGLVGGLAICAVQKWAGAHPSATGSTDVEGDAPRR